jgi:hypothetical protein
VITKTFCFGRERGLLANKRGLNFLKHFVKINVHPRTEHESPEWSQRYNFTISLTSVWDGYE